MVPDKEQQLYEGRFVRRYRSAASGERDRDTGGTASVPGERAVADAGVMRCRGPLQAKAELAVTCGRQGQDGW